MFRERKFDLRGARRILDVGSGAGQIAKHLIKYADPEAEITCFDLSHEMLRRARNRLKSDRPRFVVADLTRLPFADGSFDCVTCGYVLEHLPDARARTVRTEPGDAARRADVVADDRGHFRAAPGRAGSGAAAPIIAANWPEFARKSGLQLAPRAVVHAACTKCSAPAASAWNWSRRELLARRHSGRLFVAAILTDAVLRRSTITSLEPSDFLVHRQDFLLTFLPVDGMNCFQDADCIAERN